MPAAFIHPVNYFLHYHSTSVQHIQWQWFMWTYLIFKSMILWSVRDIFRKGSEGEKSKVCMLPTGWIGKIGNGHYHSKSTWFNTCCSVTQVLSTYLEHSTVILTRTVSTMGGKGIYPSLEWLMIYAHDWRLIDYCETYCELVQPSG